MKTPGTVVAVLVVVTASFFLLGGENTVVPARALAADVDGQYVRKAPAASADRSDPANAIRSPGNLADAFLQLLPGADPIKQLEHYRAEEDLFSGLRGRVDHVSDEVLTHTIRRAVDVREPVRRQDRIRRPGRILTGYSTEKQRLPLASEPPIRVECCGHRDTAATYP